MAGLLGDLGGQAFGGGLELPEILQRFRTDVSELINAEGAFTRFGATAAGVLQDVSSNLIKFGTIPLLGLGVAATAAGETVEKAMVTIEARTGATGDALKGLGKDFDAVAVATGQSMTSVANTIATFNSRMGLTGPILEQVSTASLNLTRMLGSNAPSVDNLAKSMAAWNISGQNIVPTMDALFQVSQRTGAPMDALTSSLAKAGPSFQQLGLNVDQSAAFLGLFNKAGQDTTRVQMGLNTFLKQSISMQMDLKTALPDTIAKIKDLSTSMNDGGQAALEWGQKMFGPRLGATFVTMIEQGKLSMQQLTALTADSNGRINDVAQSTELISVQFGKLKNEMILALAPIGQTILPEIGSLMTGLILPAFKDLGDLVGMLSPSTLHWVVGIGAALAAIGPLMRGFDSLITKASQVFDLIRGVGSAAGSTGASTAETGAMGRWTEAINLNTLALNENFRMMAELIGLSPEEVAALEAEAKAARDATLAEETSSVGLLGMLAPIGLVIAGAAGLVLGTKAVIDQFSYAGESANQLKTSLTSLANTGTGALATAFDASKVDALKQMPQIISSMNSALTLSGTGVTGLKDVTQEFSSLDKALASMVSSGNADTAGKAVDNLRAQWVAAGGSADDFNNRLPAYHHALAVDVSPPTQQATQDLSDLKDMIGSTDRAFGDFATATPAQVSAALKQMTDSIKQADAAFSASTSLADAFTNKKAGDISFTGPSSKATDALTKAQQELASAQLAASRAGATSAKDLQAQAQAQADFADQADAAATKVADAQANYSDLSSTLAQREADLEDQTNQNVADSEQRLSDLQQNLLDKRTQGEDDYAQHVIDVNQKVADAEANLADKRISTVQSVADAKQAAADADLAAQERVESAQQRITDLELQASGISSVSLARIKATRDMMTAEEELQKAKDDQVKTQEKGADSVQKAQDQAAKDLLTAEKDVTTALHDQSLLARERQQLTRDENDLVLQVAKAERDVTKAKQDQSQLGEKEAKMVMEVQKAREAVSKAEDEQNKLLQKGVQLTSDIADGTDKATQAADALEAAEQRVIDAQQKVADAQQAADDSSITAFMTKKKAQIDQFVLDTGTALAAGYDPSLIRDIVAKGPDQGGEELHQLAANATQANVDMVNSYEKTVKDVQGLTDAFVKDANEGILKEQQTGDLHWQDEVKTAAQIRVALISNSGIDSVQALADQLHLGVPTIEQAMADFNISFTDPLSTAIDTVGTKITDGVGLMTASLSSLPKVAGQVALDTAQAIKDPIITLPQWMQTAGGESSNQFVGPKGLGISMPGAAAAIAHDTGNLLRGEISPLPQWTQTAGHETGAQFTVALGGATDGVGHAVGDWRDTMLGTLNPLLTGVGAQPISPAAYHVGPGQLGPTLPAPGMASGGRVGEGFVTNQPTAIVGEGGPDPEYVIPTDSKYRANATKLWAAAGADLGMPAMMAEGGTIPGVDDLSRYGSLIGSTGEKAESFVRAAIVRFAKGKGIDVPGSLGTGTGALVDGSGWQELENFLTDLAIPHIRTSDYREGDPGYHGKGLAADFVGADDSEQQMVDIFNAFYSVGSQMAELIHNPTGGIKDGHDVPPSFWGADTWAAHTNHVHSAIEAGTQLRLPGPQGGQADTAGGKGQNVSGSLDDWINQGLSLASEPSDWHQGIYNRAMQESNGDPNAENDWDINAQEGHPTEGIMQMRDDTFAAHAVPGHLDIWNPVDNIASASRYIEERYGSPYNLPSGGYAVGGILPLRSYDQGGPLPPGLTLAYNGTGAPEQVIAGGIQQGQSAIAQARAALASYGLTGADHGALDAASAQLDSLLSASLQQVTMAQQAAAAAQTSAGAAAAAAVNAVPQVIHNHVWNVDASPDAAAIARATYERFAWESIGAT